MREQRRRRALVIEVKWADKNADLEKECREALDQIERKQYVKNLYLEGFTTVLCYGAAFLGKNCLVKLKK